MGLRTCERPNRNDCGTNKSVWTVLGRRREPVNRGVDISLADLPTFRANLVDETTMPGREEDAR